MQTDDTPEAAASLRRQRVGLAAIFLFCGMSLGVWAAHIPVIRAVHALSERDLGIALLAVSLGAVLVMPLTGFIAARLGSGRATLVTATGLALALPLPIMAPNFVAVLAAALLFGAAFGSLDVAMNTHATQLEEQWGSPIMSSIHGFYSLGGLIGALAGALIVRADLAGGEGALLTSASFLGALVVLRRPIAASGTLRLRAAPVLTLPRRPAVLLGALAFLAFMIEGAMLDWSGVYLVESGVSIAAAASGYAGFSLAMTLGRFFGDPIVARLGRRIVLGGGGALIAVGLVAIVVLPEHAPVVVGCVLVGMGAANIVPVLFTLGGRLPGIPASYGVAAVATIGYGGLLAGPPLIGFIAHIAGLRGSFLVLTLLALALAWGGLAVARRHVGAL